MAMMCHFRTEQVHNLTEVVSFNKSYEVFDAVGGRKQSVQEDREPRLDPLFPPGVCHRLAAKRGWEYFTVAETADP